MSNNNDFNDEEKIDSVNIFISKKKAVDSNIDNNMGKIDFAKHNSLFSAINNSTQIEKKQNAQRILGTQKEKMIQNKNVLGIGLLSANINIGKNSILDGQTIKMENLTIQNKDNIIGDDINKRKTTNNNNINSINIDEKKKNNLYQRDKDREKSDDKFKYNDEVEEIIENKKEFLFQNNNIVEIKDNEIIKNYNNDQQQEIDIKKDSINIQKHYIVDENDPRMKLYTLINSKDELEDINTLKHFLITPLTKKQIFRCNIIRKKDGLDKAFPKYFVYCFPNDRFLMSAKKMPKNSTANYLITMNKNKFEKDENSLGKLRSNFFGTEFNLFDNGKNPKDSNNNEELRSFLSGIEYETNLFGLKGPRKMKVCLPGLTETETIAEIKNVKKGESLLELLNKGDKRIICFRNKLPKWNESK
jgi:tubby-related protein 1